MLLDVVRGELLVWADDEGRSFARHALSNVHSPTLRDLATRAREQVVEACAEHDDAFAELWLAAVDRNERISDDALVAAIRRGTMALRFVPILGGSAFRNRGVQPLLDAVVAYLPSPLDRRRPLFPTEERASSSGQRNERPTGQGSALGPSAKCRKTSSKLSTRPYAATRW
ncbi:MAG: hypothetical protein MUE69_00180 [Myxococcota bacterium]|nr:hypothetical protein [Myxococcota bacterium]